MQLDQYLSSLPLLHTWDNGKTWNTGGFKPSQLRSLHDFLHRSLPAHPTVLETGAGNSTICLSFLQPAVQTTICPDQALFDRIETYCRGAGIPTGRIDYRLGFSEWVLPEMAAPTRDSGPVLDFGLIDGGHNWPTVFVDFFYMNVMLREGGYLMLDDLQLHSVKELGRLLVEQPGYELCLDERKFLVFRKTIADRTLPEWNSQPYILRRSKEYGRSADPFAL